MNKITILSRQETRLNPIKSHSSSWGQGINKTTEYLWSYHRQDPKRSYSKRLPNQRSKPFVFLPFCVGSSGVIVNHKFYAIGQTLGQDDNSRQWEYNVAKHVEKQIQYTNSFVIKFWKQKKQTKTPKGQRARHRISPTPGTRNWVATLGVHTVPKEASPVHTWHVETQTWVLFFLLATKSSTPKYYLEVAVRFHHLIATSKSLFKTKWQFGIVQFLGVISVSVY